MADKMQMDWKTVQLALTVYGNAETVWEYTEVLLGKLRDRLPESVPVGGLGSLTAVFFQKRTAD